MAVLPCHVVEQWAGVDQTAPQFCTLDEVVSWRTIPTFLRMGRTAWLSLAEPLRVSAPSCFRHVKALKLKGVGLLDHLGNVSQPSTCSYYRIHSHLGFSPRGDFVS